MSKPLRIAVFGTGYWAQFQIAAWQAIGAQVVAVWNRTREKAVATAQRFSIPTVFDTPEQAFAAGDFDITDIIADVGAHEPLVLMAAQHKKDVICQKPMASDYPSCQRMVEACRKADVWYAVHENFRYQPQFAPVKQWLDSGALGAPLHAHVQLRSPDREIIFKQPALAQKDHMVLRDMGPHIFDVIRFLLGDIASIYTHSVQSYPDIPVHDTALSQLTMHSGIPVLCSLVHEFAYKVYVQCQHGSLLLDQDNVLFVRKEGEEEQRIDTRTWPTLPYIPAEDWALHGGHVFAAIPLCLADLAQAYRQGVPAPTSGEDNLKTMAAVFAAIRSQETGLPVQLDSL